MIDMQEKPSTANQGKSRTMTFCRTASVRMRKKVKHMSRALTFRKRSWDLSQSSDNSKEMSMSDNSTDRSSLELGQSDATFTLLASLDEVYQSVIETSRDLACAIDRLDQTPKRPGSSAEGGQSEDRCDEQGDLYHQIQTNFPEETESTSRPEVPPPCVLLPEEKDRLTEVDDRAVQLSSRDYTCLTDLTQDLTLNCRGDLEKARVLFRWIVAVCDNTSSAHLLHKYRKGDVPYHKLYQDLCRLAGLDCRIILGWSKSSGYKPSMALSEGMFRNSWTAVSIDSTWRFVNCVWGARHVSSSEGDGDVIHRLDDFYFLTHPEDHIYQHFPEDPDWQLLETPVSLNDFLQLPVLKSAFFRYDLEFTTPCSSPVTTDSGVVEIRLKTPEIFAFGSVLETSEGGPMCRIEKCVLQTVVDDEVIFRVSLPYPGQYHFSVYVGDYWQPQFLESACSVLIDFKEAVDASKTFPTPYPPVPFYGRTPVADTLGVDCPTDPLLVLCNSNHEITFNVSPDTHVTETFQHLDSQSGTLVDMDRYAFPVSRTNGKLRYSFECPHRGYYVFSLYATKDSTMPLDVVYRCLLFAQQDTPSAAPFPVSHTKWTNCTLHSPLSGYLTPNSVTYFKLKVPMSKQVFVSVSGKIYPLAPTPSGLWEGDVAIGTSGSVVKVMGEFRNSNGVALTSCLLDYEILEPKETTV